ncbi:MAG: L,D-transpeptidase family protein [Taibaiella sp.]|nr:L,D-transpeptidase family protein [Taibaiella sp.]
MIVYKAKRKLLVFNNGTLLKTYSIALGKNPVGRKEYEGDFKTPEGAYTIYAKNPNSTYHKNLGISYPNALDKANAAFAGRPTGGDIKIHGCNKKLSFIGRLHRRVDWTHGCIALTDDEIDELYAHVQVGTRINIYP